MSPTERKRAHLARLAKANKKQISAVLSEDTLRDLQVVMEREGVSRGDAVELVLRAHFASNPPTRSQTP